MKKYNRIILILALTLASCSTTKFNKSMSIEKIPAIVHLDDKSPTFSGNVEVQMLFSEKNHEPSRLTGAEVKFNPRARSAWHTHPRGQLLVVTEGEGIVQEWGEPARKISKGNVVWTPPGVKHWHGACADKFVKHYALQEKDSNGKNVIWMEKVSEEEYEKAAKME
ncbi:(R)-mandelonitrile lyase [Halobacteriovorax marinus]|nr:cupin domain-containing protein [Halobacteriovorax marinus]